MTAHQCFTILGVPPTASKKEIRKAYDELMQVWNPDRFASDSRLQRLAPVVCLLINEAYCTIDRGQYQPAPEPPRPQASKYAAVLELMQWFLFGRVRRGITFLAIAAIPVMLGIMIVKSVRVPNFDPFHPATEAIELPYLPYVPDLWPRRNTAVPSIYAQPNRSPENTPQPSRMQRRAGRANDQPLTPWNNGTETTWSSRSGTGLIHVINQSPVAVYVRLVQSSNVPVKAIYVQRENSADLTSIPNGTYSAMIETGNSWSGKTLKFLDSNRAPELVGKFVFYEVESAQGSIGCTFTIVLRTNPSTGHAQTHLD